MNHGADDLSNCSVDGFDDAVGSGRVGADGARIDACIGKKELEVLAVEFGAIVMDNFARARVARKPASVKKVSGFASFG